MSANVEISGDLEKVLSLDRQVAFAASRAINETARQAQDSAIRAIQATFTTRARWFQPSNRFGVRVKPSRKDDLEATISTAADWLVPHETGGVKRARSGKDLAIAIVGTGGARPRFSSKLRANLKPRALGSQAFVIKTKNGPVLFYRRGKRQRLTPLFAIEHSARIRKRSTVVEPTVKVFARRFDRNFDKALREALATASPGGGREAKGVWAFD